MPLALIVVLLVVGVTAVAGGAGYLIDLSVRRHEGQSGDKGQER